MADKHAESADVATTAVVPDPAERRLSPLRVTLTIIAVLALAAAGAITAQHWASATGSVESKPWYAGYVDVTATPTFAFENAGKSQAPDAVLSFVVSAEHAACSPSWGGVYSLTQASAGLDLDRRIARLQQRGGSVAVSFGGQAHQELAVGCTDESKLREAYSSVISRYKLNTIDLDLEGAGLTDPDAAVRRASAIAGVQKAQRADGKELAVWLTLPVEPSGLDPNGTNAITAMLNADVDIAGVNIMTMDFGSSRAKGQSMLNASTSALTNAQRQLGVLYQRAGHALSQRALWSKIGATPMIGQNDDRDEVFTLGAAKGLNAFAVDHKIGRMSMWSANRDATCGSNYVNLKVVSDGCSGVRQHGTSFASVLGAGFDGSLALSSSRVATAEPTNSRAQDTDDPATSPYPVWSGAGSYLQGTKIVWHHNVYEAKWWTHGDLPDNPVLNSWETPWNLIGPVLAGEKPIPQATLPAGTYPDWAGTDVYTAGARVLFDGVPFQAKWWNQGQSPAAAASNADNSPWAPLTQAQIDAVTNDADTPAPAPLSARGDS
jgi:chitinase